MKQGTVLRHEFVESTPRVLEDNVLYVSIAYDTVIHKCCCGCGNKVVTPLSPARWKLIYDGETVSLDPSIGNWSFPCQSHYWIIASSVKWAGQWTQEEIATARVYQQAEREQHLGRPIGSNKVGDETQPVEQIGEGFWQKLRRWLGI